MLKEISRNEMNSLLDEAGITDGCPWSPSFRAVVNRRSDDSLLSLAVVESNDTQAVIHVLWVTEPLRGQGFGRSLLNDLMDELGDIGCETVEADMPHSDELEGLLSSAMFDLTVSGGKVHGELYM